ncbi:DUF2231 domain-containing protein [Maribacter sp. HTCC2170]|uniref:DUF2231 domain-containing protein n=1 Tax=Maribacter sp. (strain HTCC2170 / KCCM 42371) TaxID=313603 RepID=UPI00006BD4C4|nr:DUF2231 domain-containing protein [Maribacter sp. HTCC2170]EAR02900.1 hypothetical protein FB2170_06415 [Maribacter sp. HTCC2170]
MESASDFILFLGRFHPLIVHLPIGFLIFAFVLELIGGIRKKQTLTEVVPLALLLGMLTALTACILGYMLSQSGDYDEEALNNHLWFGIATTIIAFFAWLIKIDKIRIPKIEHHKLSIIILVLLMTLLMVTGHYGGNLTHGSDYLFKYAPFGKKEEKKLKPLETIEEAEVFDYLVEPILGDKCISCHNSGKKKGGLSYEDETSILKGSENGPVLTAGNASKSEMIRRIQLDSQHEDFMPPEGKTPLTEEEKTILIYWIENAKADFTIKVDSVETSDEILYIASNMLGLERKGEGRHDKLPAVEMVDPAILEEIILEGFRIRELIFGSNLYEVVLPAKTISKANLEIWDEKLQKLLKIKENIISLSLADNYLNDKHLKSIGQFQNLKKLRIHNNPITDFGVAALVSSKNITRLNLYGTKITKASLDTFSKMEYLEKVYVWKTTITKENIQPYIANGNYPEIIFGI